MRLCTKEEEEKSKDKKRGRKEEKRKRRKEWGGRKGGRKEGRGNKERKKLSFIWVYAGGPKLWEAHKRFLPPCINQYIICNAFQQINSTNGGHFWRDWVEWSYMGLCA